MTQVLFTWPVSSVWHSFPPSGNYSLDFLDNTFCWFPFKFSDGFFSSFYQFSLLDLFHLADLQIKGSRAPISSMLMTLNTVTMTVLYFLDADALTFGALLALEGLACQSQIIPRDSKQLACL